MRIRMLVFPLLIAAFGLPMVVSAQQPEGAVAAAEQQQFSGQQLKQFTDAYKAIQRISRDYKQRLQSAASREQAIKLQQEANEKMLQAIRQNGLSLDEYRTIARAASDNPELAQRIRDML